MIVFHPLFCSTVLIEFFSNLLVSPLVIISGYAFIRRKKYAVAVTYVWIGLYVVSFLIALLQLSANKALTFEQQIEQIGKHLGTMIAGCVFWGCCAVYYRKRRAEA
jgi:hypothetical protein